MAHLCSPHQALHTQTVMSPHWCTIFTSTSCTILVNDRCHRLNKNSTSALVLLKKDKTRSKYKFWIFFQKASSLKLLQHLPLYNLWIIFDCVLRSLNDLKRVSSIHMRLQKLTPKNDNKVLLVPAMWSGTICKNDEHKWDNCSPSKVLTIRTQKILIQTDKTQKLLLNFPIKVKVRVMTQGVFIPALFSPSESDSGLFSSLVQFICAQ